MFYLEIYGNGWLIPLLFILKRCSSDLGTHQELTITLELFDSPHYSILIWLVLGFTCSCWVNFALGCVWRHWDLSYHIGCKVCSFEDSFEFNAVFHTILFREFLNYRHNLKRKIYIFRNSVSHNFEYSIRWNKGNWSIAIKLSKSHALMEFDIVNLYSTILLCWICGRIFHQ